jgi:hypothetical protein
MSPPPGMFRRLLTSREADRFLRQLVSNTAPAARFAEPSAAERPHVVGWHDGVTAPARPQVRARASRLRSARARSLAAALVVIGCLSAGLCRLLWLIISHR